jgi:hypothetical protein
MMNPEKERIIKAKETIDKISKGINPLNDDQIEDSSFLHDGRIIRCLNFIQEILGKAIEGDLRSYSKKNADFIITDEEKKRIELPKGKIGINQFAKCVNDVIDLDKSRKLTGMEINKKLKKMGILGEQSLEDGKTRTILSDRSQEFGIESETRNNNGSSYEMILFNETGKKYLLDSLEKIMQFKG